MDIGGLDLPETTESTPIKIFCDAARDKGNGVCAAGWAFCTHNGAVLEVENQHLGKFDSIDEAEIEAVKRVLDGITGYNHVQHVKICTDSQNAVSRLCVDALSNGYETVTIEWIPRAENQVADTAAKSVTSRSRGVPTSEGSFGVCD